MNMLPSRGNLAKWLGLEFLDATCASIDFIAQFGLMQHMRERSFCHVNIIIISFEIG